MKSWTLWLSGAFSAGIVILAAAAAWRAAPVAIAGSPQDAGWRDGSRTREFEAHYDAAFPARTLGINTWATIAYLLFREGKPGVVVGERDWLYTAEEFGAPPGAEAQVEAHLALVPQVKERLAERGSELLVALVPAKARVYPETLGERLPAPLHTALYGRALHALHESTVAAPDLLAALAECKAKQAPQQTMFLRTDTHWTPAGARCAAARIAAEARAAGLRAGTPVPYRTSVESVAVHRGDLMTFLPLDPWFERLLPPGDRLEQQRTEPVAAGTGPGSSPGQDLLNEAPRPQVVLVGTSYSDPRWNFTGALQENLGEDVVNYAAPARGPFLPMLEYLDSADFASAPPRLVIWEVPERYFPMRDDTPDPSQPQGATT